MNRIATHTLLTGIVLLCLAACSSHDSTDTPHCIMPQGTQLREGDVVLRMGSGITSHAVATADRDGQYSHIGIVADSCGTLMIVHAVPGEPDFAGDIDRVKLDKPEKFFNSIYAVRGAVYRPTDAKAGRRAAQSAMATYRRGTAFDHDYDSSDTSQMYCTELVAHAYHNAGADVVGAPSHDINLPGLHTRCWLPSDFHKAALLKSKYTF